MNTDDEDEETTTHCIRCGKKIESFCNLIEYCGKDCYIKDIIDLLKTMGHTDEDYERIRNILNVLYHEANNIGRLNP